jgi:hypothetical protein
MAVPTRRLTEKRTSAPTHRLGSAYPAPRLAASGEISSHLRSHDLPQNAPNLT